MTPLRLRRSKTHTYLFGLGAREVLREPGAGHVSAVYARVAYVEMPNGIFALTKPEIPPGPLHARIPVRLHLEVGYPVMAYAGSLYVAARNIPWAASDVWRGALPEPAAMAAATGLADEVLGTAPPSALLEEPWRPVVERATAALEKGDVGGAAAALGGVGPGLTPAGDDALAGIFLAARVRFGEGAEHDLLDVADLVRTSDLALAFLHWAARGQGIAPVHDFLEAVVTDDRAAASDAVGRLSAFGHSSGADLALGLRMGLVSLTG